MVAGSVVESRESSRTAMLVGGPRESSARSEADALAREFSDLPGGGRLAGRMLICRAETNPASWAAQMRSELQNLKR